MMRSAFAIGLLLASTAASAIPPGFKAKADQLLASAYAATGPGASLPTELARFSAATPVTAAPAATPMAAGSGTGAGAGHASTVTAGPATVSNATTPAAAGPGTAAPGAGSHAGA